MAKGNKESISFKEKYQKEYEFLLKESKGNKSWYICELLREKRLEKEKEEKRK